MMLHLHQEYWSMILAPTEAPTAPQIPQGSSLQSETWLQQTAPCGAWKRLQKPAEPSKAPRTPQVLDLKSGPRTGALTLFSLV